MKLTRSVLLVLLAALASYSATCGGLTIGPPGTKGCSPDQYPVTYPGGAVACILVGTSPPSSIYPSPEVSPEPSSTPEPSPTPLPPSPTPDPTPTPRPSPTPVATPTPKPCSIDPDKLPCWLVRHRLANDTGPGADTGWREIGQNFFEGRRGNVVFYVACESRNPFARCWRAHADGRPAPELHQPEHGTIFGTWYPQGFLSESNPGGHPDHVGSGICLASYVASLCPSPTPSPTPEATPPPESPAPSPGSTPQPGPTPATCPPLVRWGGGLHAQMTPSFEGLPKDPFFAGNTADLDSTARFGGSAGGRGRPCNDEHHAVCEANGIDDGPSWRRCEDPRGPVFTVTSCGVDKVKVINGGWGLRLIGVHAGRCCVKIEPREDVQDHEGLPVRVLGDASTEACFEAR